MISLREAEEIVNAELKKQERVVGGIALKIVSSSTIEQDFGWVFFYNSKEYLESGNLSYMLAGNAPIIIDKADGSLHFTGTSNPIDYYIEKYRENIRGRKVPR